MHLSENVRNVVVSYLVFAFGFVTGLMVHGLFTFWVCVAIMLIGFFTWLFHATRQDRRAIRERNQALLEQAGYVAQVYPGDEERAKAVLEYQQDLERNRGNE